MEGPQAQRLLRWYASLRTRTVDLVGDYAGDELFIIEGDSLLLHSFCDEKLDFDPGLQVLHAVYILERFLASLHERRCNFRLVFFEKHAGLCVPPNTPEKIRARYLMAREAIVRHLTDNLDVKVFKSYGSKEFRDYLAASGAYFVMCHDGAFPKRKVADDDLEDEAVEEAEDEDEDEDEEEGSEDEEEEEGDSEDEGAVKGHIESTTHNVGFRAMMNWFVSRGYNIALINGLESRDTKTMAMIVEGTAEKARQVLEYVQPSLASNSQSEDEKDGAGLESSNIDECDSVIGNSIDRKQLLPQYLTVLSQSGDLTQSEWVIASAIGLMVKLDVIKPTQAAEIRAMLLHIVICHEYRLTDRSVLPADMAAGQPFLNAFATMACNILRSDGWDSALSKNPVPCDLADVVDGRLFLYLLGQHQADYLSNPSVVSKYGALASLLKRLCGGIELDLELRQSGSGPQKNENDYRDGLEKPVKVLPFSNSVFDAHLAPVHLSVDKSEPTPKPSTAKIFTELSHWHNHPRPVAPKVAVDPKVEEKKTFFANRRNQFFMAEMRDYAASLTNATGSVLEPETVFVQSAKDKKQKGNAPPANVESAPKGKQKGGPAKAGKKNVKHAVRDAAGIATQKKRNEAVDKQIQAWTNVKANYDKDSDLAKRYAKVNQYLVTLPKDKRAMVQGEVLTYMLNILVETWIAKCTAGEREQALHVAARIWEMASRISKLKDGITPDIVTCVTQTVKALRLPPLEFVSEPQRTSKLSFQFVDFESVTNKVDTGLSPTEFQLVHAGPYFDRNMGSAPDHRVNDFEPDKWQREVLDEIDANNSLFVVAPTSAGKTFISFYAMKRVLEDDDDGVLVYVAPTKALVNQIAAEVQARFSKNFKHGGKSVWGIHTRDYRINNPTGCQVLVTVPHILQIMLLAPANANSWSARVKRIIFDEVHCIGQAEDGVVWEQLLLMAPCPIIALSATVGNPNEFGSQWLQLAQKANNIELKMIEHRHRYSDLRKYVYYPPKKFHFNGLPDPVQFPSLGLDSSDVMAYMHPVVSLIDRSRGMPDDLSFEARDCWLLWKAMTKYQTPKFPVDKSLDPSVALPESIRKVDVVDWEAKLKRLLKEWIVDLDSPFVDVRNELEKPLTSATRPTLQVSSGKMKESEELATLEEENYVDTTLPLLCSLQEQGALPALLFNYDRAGCEKMCLSLLEQLEKAESEWKESSPKWKAKVTAWEAWKEAQEKLAKKKPAAAPKGKKGGDDMTKEERMQDASNSDSSPLESFDPDSPVDGYHFADVRKVTPSDFEKYTAELRRRDVSEWLINGLRRGIGVHHAGMNRKYRQLCEILFRKGYLRVVVATGTLALGINMPCKTVVFSGDSIFLTALNFRQAAGRAGRRGFDMLGNVVFQAVPYQKVCRLLSSRLPDLKGHFPITTSLVLRLFALLHESKRSSNAVKMINSILSSPHIYLGGPEARDTVLHHLRFSIEYLRRNHLLSPLGAPLNFAGCVSHLYFVENSSFAFHALLKDGYFHEVCGDIEKPENMFELMLVMSHLFGQQRLRKSVLEHQKSAAKKSSSIILLPPLPQRAKQTLRSHNKDTLDIYSAYVKTFVDEHVKDIPDCHLPLTGAKYGGDEQLRTDAGTTDDPSAKRINSAFVALSGHRDKWENISELCDMVRSGVWLEKSVVPYVALYEEDASPLNAYLLDFFRHGSVSVLERDNGIRSGEVWYLLNDFSLVLATIVTSLENFLKLTPGTEVDMLEVAGSGDLAEGEVDEKLIDFDAGGAVGAAPGGPAIVPLKQQQAIPTPVRTLMRKAKVVDSWDEGMSESESDEELEAETQLEASEDPMAWNAEESGILTVLKGFKVLQRDFNEKFRKMWA